MTKRHTSLTSPHSDITAYRAVSSQANFTGLSIGCMRGVLHQGFLCYPLASTSDGVVAHDGCMEQAQGHSQCAYVAKKEKSL